MQIQTLINRRLPTTAFSVLAAAMLMAGALTTSFEARAEEDDYRKAVEGEDVVRNKLFPKKGRIELNGPDVGVILNQSYVNTFLFHGGLNYYFSEVWGFGAEVALAINNDKNERNSIENFYNNPRKSPGPQYGPDDQVPAGGNYGPAYVPIRELKYIIAGNAIWNPVYGKQIMLLRATAYFDVFVTIGGGMAFSDYYPLSTELRNGKPSRGTFPESGTGGPGARPGETDADGNLLYGTEGRPDVVNAANPLVNFGVGQKYHFAKRFNVKAELRNYTLLGTDSGFDNFFTLWGGFGMRF